MDEFLILLQAKLDEAISKGNINADINKIQNQIDKLKIQAEIDPKTISNLVKQLEGILNQKINISNITIDQSQAVKTAQQTGQQIGNAINQGVTSAVNKTNNTLKSFSDLKNFSELNKSINNIHVDSSELKNYKSILDDVKNTYAEFGQVKITNEIFKDGILEKFKVNIEQVNGDLKETKSFIMALNEDKDAFVFSGLISGSESIVQHLDKTKNAVNQTAEAINALKEKAQIDKIQLLSNGGIKNDYSTQIAKLEGNFRNLGLIEDDIHIKTSKVMSAFDALKTRINQPFDESNYQEIISLNDKLQKELIESANEYTKLQSSTKGYVSVQQRLSKANTIEAWNLKNKNATQEVRSVNESYINSLRDLNTEMSRVKFNEVSDGFSRMKNSMTALGKISTAVKGQISQAMTSLVSFMSLSRVVMKVVNWFVQMPSTVKTLDTALVDLRKTAKMSEQELEDFYYASNDVAKQMGVTTDEILNQAAAWSRLGFNTAETATQMAKLSSQFSLISPGLSVDDATSGLVSIMKAYDIKVSDVLDGIESKINIVGNNLALSNANIVRMLQDSVSAMAEGRNTLEETIALESAAYEITQNESVGNGFKTVALRLRGMNEETEELDESLKTIKGDLYELTGISIMENENTYKSTYQILKEISEVWDSLTDKTRAEALELMFGKQRSNIGAAVLKNFSAAEKAMDLMADSAGNADAELSVAMDSIEYKMNRLSETSTSVAQNLFKRDDMKTVLDGLTSIMSVFDKLSSKLGLFGSIGLGTGLFSSIKNVGMA